MICRDITQDEVAMRNYTANNMSSMKIAYWIRTEITSYDSELVMNTTTISNIMGVTNVHDRIIYKSDLEDSYREYYVPDNGYLQKQFVRQRGFKSLRIGYESLYRMILNDERYATLLEENRALFISQLRDCIIEAVTKDYRNCPSNYTYTWFYFNCVSLGIDLDYDEMILNLENIDKDSIELSVLYKLLCDKLIEVLA